MAKKKYHDEMPNLAMEMPSLFGEAKPQQKARRPRQPRRQITKKEVYYYGSPHRTGGSVSKRSGRKPDIRMDPQLDRAIQRTKTGVKLLRKHGPEAIVKLRSFFTRKKKSIYGKQKPLEIPKAKQPKKKGKGEKPRWTIT